MSTHPPTFLDPPLRNILTTMSWVMHYVSKCSLHAFHHSVWHFIWRKSKPRPRYACWSHVINIHFCTFCLECFKTGTVYRKKNKLCRFIGFKIHFSRLNNYFPILHRSFKTSIILPVWRVLHGVTWLQTPKHRELREDMATKIFWFSEWSDWRNVAVFLILNRELISLDQLFQLQSKNFSTYSCNFVV